MVRSEHFWGVMKLDTRHKTRCSRVRWMWNRSEQGLQKRRVSSEILLKEGPDVGQGKIGVRLKSMRD